MPGGVSAVMTRVARALPGNYTTKLGRLLLAGGLSEPFVCVWPTSASHTAAGHGSLRLGTAPCKVSYS